MDKYYAFPSHYFLNTCSAGDNYVHVQTVDTRLFFSPSTKSLGTRLVVMPTPSACYYIDDIPCMFYS